MKLENVEISEDGNRYVAFCKKDVNGHLLSFALSNTLKQSQVEKSYVVFDNANNVIEEAVEIGVGFRFYDEFSELQAALTEHIANQGLQINA